MSDVPNPPADAPRRASGETSYPPALAPEAAAPAPGPRRVDWRPKLRWFGAEYLIVVLGVLTAVGLNAWWQGRQDAAREDVLLRQIVDDLEETERLMLTGDERAKVGYRANRQLIQAFYAAVPPPGRFHFQMAPPTPSNPDPSPGAFKHRVRHFDGGPPPDPGP